MIKILVSPEAGQLNGVTFWRALRPLSELRRMYPDKITYEIAKRGVPVFDMSGYDVFFALRPNGKQDKNVIETAKLLGLKVVLDIDDDLWNIPPLHPKFTEFEEQRQITRECYDLADWIWCSTPQLMYAADCFGRGSVVPNAILPEDLPEVPAPWRGIAVWRGSILGKCDIESKDARKWYSENKNHFNRFVFHGYTPDLPHGSNFAAKKSVDTISYFYGLRGSGANVVWKPMEDNLFNQAKSNIAWIEATMSGGVCITNFAGREGWEHCITRTSQAMENFDLWAQSRDAILSDYNLRTVNQRRYIDLINLLPQNRFVDLISKDDLVRI